MSNIKKKITYAKKILEVLKEIDLIDTKLTRKYKRNQNELELYDSLLEESNNNFLIITHMLKPTQPNK